jgi:hypothetical protein
MNDSLIQKTNRFFRKNLVKHPKKNVLPGRINIIGADLQQ